MLHIVNGDSVGLAETGLKGDVIAWRDSLHEGPVPAELPLDVLSRERASFLAKALDLDRAKTRRQFASRDRALSGYSKHEEITLWFEDDLYDQLQLIQVLDWFGHANPPSARLTLVQAEVPLGPMGSDELNDRFAARRRVTRPQLQLAVRAWKAFRSPDPRPLAKLAVRGAAALPFLGAALLRHLEEFPSVENGLARTERQILEILLTGPRPFAPLFRAAQRREERPYLGDSWLAWHLRRLARCEEPLVAERSGAWAILETGARVLSGDVDQVRLNGTNRWLGGVELRGIGPVWRWNAAEHSLEQS